MSDRGRTGKISVRNERLYNICTILIRRGNQSKSKVYLNYLGDQLSGRERISILSI